MSRMPVEKRFVVHARQHRVEHPFLSLNEKWIEEQIQDLSEQACEECKNGTVYGKGLRHPRRTTCSHPKCKEAHYANGLCRIHYGRAYNERRKKRDGTDWRNRRKTK